MSQEPITITLTGIGNYQFIVRRFGGLTSVILEADIVDADGKVWDHYGPVERTEAMSPDDAILVGSLVQTALQTIRTTYGLPEPEPEPEQDEEESDDEEPPPE